MLIALHGGLQMASEVKYGLRFELIDLNEAYTIQDWLFVLAEEEMEQLLRSF